MIKVVSVDRNRKYLQLYYDELRQAGISAELKLEEDSYDDYIRVDSDIASVLSILCPLQECIVDTRRTYPDYQWYIKVYDGYAE